MVGARQLGGDGMSFVSVATDAASDAIAALQGLGPQVEGASAAAAAPTSGIAAAAQDEVSAAIARVFGDFGREFQSVSAQAQAFQQRFLGNLGAGFAQYANAEAANVQQALSALIPIGGLSAAPVSYPVLDYSTPIGPINLTLYGDSGPPLAFNKGFLSVPPPLALLYDTVSPFANVALSVRSGGIAFNTAMQAGNPGGAATALLQTPFNALGSFFFGGNAVTGSVQVNPLTGYTAFDYNFPVGGLFSPVSPAIVTLHGTGGTSTIIPLDGTQFGGPFAGLGSEITRLFTRT